MPRLTILLGLSRRSAGTHKRNAMPTCRWTTGGPLLSLFPEPTRPHMRVTPTPCLYCYIYLSDTSWTSPNSFFSFFSLFLLFLTCSPPLGFHISTFCPELKKNTTTDHVFRIDHHAGLVDTLSCHRSGCDRLPSLCLQDPRSLCSFLPSAKRLCSHSKLSSSNTLLHQQDCRQRPRGGCRDRTFTSPCNRSTERN